MEIRLLIAFVLMGLVLAGTQYFYKPVQPPPAVEEAEKEAPKQDAKQPTAAIADSEKKSEAKAAELAVPGAVQADRDETFEINTDLYHVTFANRGGVARSWILKAFKDHNGKPLDLVNQAALKDLPAPFSLGFRGQAPTPDLNLALFQGTLGPDGRSITFEYSDGHTAVKKSFTFEPKSYMVAVSSSAAQNGVALPHTLMWRGGFGDATIVNPGATQHAIYYDLSNSKLQEKQAKDAKNGPVTSSGQYSFAGLNDSYFAGVFLPAQRAQVEMTVYGDNLPDAAGKPEPRVGAGVGGDGSNSFTFFAGPKDSDLLGTWIPSWNS